MEEKITVITFKTWLENKNLQPSTIGKYLAHCSELNVLDQAIVSQYINAHNTLLARASLKNLIRFYIENQDIALQNGQTIETLSKIFIPDLKHKIKKEIQPISLTQVYMIEEKLSNERLRLMLLIGFWGGCRINELLKMRVSNIKESLDAWLKDESKMGRINVIAKGGTEMFVSIIPPVMDRLFKWFEEQKYTVDDLDKKVWKIAERRWRDVLETASLEVLGRKVNPHLLRHSIATHYIRKNKSLMAIKGHLRHKSIISTQIYTHMAREQVETELMSDLELKP